MSLEQDMAELAAVTARLQQIAGNAGFDPASLCFGDQRLFVDDLAQFVVACTTRRAGKTTGSASKLLKVARSRPNVIAIYVTLTRRTAEELVWEPLKKLNDEHSLGGSVNNTKLVMRLPNGSTIICAGCKDKREAEKLRGLSRVAIAIIDEVQSFAQDVIEYLVHDVIEPSLLDVRGALVLTGTPGLVPAGFFYESTQNQAYSQHRWSLRDNPHLGEDVDAYLAGIRARRGITDQHPTYRREYLGEWVQDFDALMFHYDAGRNACEWQESPQDGWTYVLVYDTGWHDADAIGVLGWNRYTREVRLVWESVDAKRGVTELGNAMRSAFNMWSPIAVVGDTGGLGRKIAEELRKRWGIPVQAADKTRKAEHIELTNDALRTGKLKAPPDSRFAQDCAVMQWDMDAKAKGILREDPGCHSDACDMVLYGFRRCMAFLEPVAPSEAPQPGTPEHSKHLADEMMQHELDQQRRAADLPWWEDMAGVQD